MSDMVQCHGCPRMAQDVPLAALPHDWDALRVPGYEPMLFCPWCVNAGRMEETRAKQGLPRRQRWAFPQGIHAVYRPAAREVLLATPDGFAELSEDEAVRLHGALSEALAVRSLGGRLIAEVKR